MHVFHANLCYTLNGLGVLVTAESIDGCFLLSELAVQYATLGGTMRDVVWLYMGLYQLGYGSKPGTASPYDFLFDFFFVKGFVPPEIHKRLNP